MASRCKRYTWIALSSFPALPIFPGKAPVLGEFLRMRVRLHWASFKTFKASPFVAHSIVPLTQNGPRSLTPIHTGRSWAFSRSVRGIGRHRRRLPVGRLGGTRGAFCLCPRMSNTLKTHWRSHILASTDCLELGMSDAAAHVLDDEIAPEDKNRSRRGPR